MGDQSAAPLLASAGHSMAKEQLKSLRDWIKSGPLGLQVLSFLVSSFTVFVSVFTVIGDTLSIELFMASTMVYVGVFAFCMMVPYFWLILFVLKVFFMQRLWRQSLVSVPVA